MQADRLAYWLRLSDHASLTHQFPPASLIIPPRSCQRLYHCFKQKIHTSTVVYGMMAALPPRTAGIVFPRLSIRRGAGGSRGGSSPFLILGLGAMTVGAPPPQATHTTEAGREKHQCLRIDDTERPWDITKRRKKAK
ncbi:uncharacterized protein BO80DRAFT_28760 [Aspergillus ibericus CBS 121593]|uniref:Uncharacterized protein n=1 Tax=Aspergillus ibericus CBS 121593 TaxID=1448316 RepID=A0A395H473_9EURO|nr:hypothetical protein BO80DRAFT_28760 [Aspergillus ibericus CBS 121593]RAL02682.1 hypothetical protein BO80DRAFT_28760 [Aspergillus ibericus CBS 121593]